MRRVFLAFLSLGFLATHAFAQGTGQINGALTDTSGGVIPGATVSAVESATGIKTDTVTGRQWALLVPIDSTHHL